MLCFEVFAGVGAREQPWSTRATTGCAEIRPVMEVLSEYVGERFGHWDRLGPKGNTHLLWREDDGGCLQPGDADSVLAELAGVWIAREIDSRADPTGKLLAIA